MNKKIKALKGFKIFSVLLMSTSLLPLTPVYAEESVQEVESAEIEKVEVETEQIDEEIEPSQTNEIMSVSKKVKKGWVDEGSNRYYYNDKGVKQIGWQEIDDQIYYFNKDGTLETDFSKLDKNYTKKEFVEAMKDYAVPIARDHDLYASVTVAQAILETGYGTSKLSRPPNYNWFGIKGSYDGQSAYMQTNEDDGKGNIFSIKTDFRRYPNPATSVKDYVERLAYGPSSYGKPSWNKYFYQGAWRSKTNNYTDVTAFLTGKYATDTRYYYKLNKIIAEFKLYELDGDKLVTNPTLPKGWQNVDGKVYLVDNKGQKQTGWQTLAGEKYYLNSKGVLQTGFVKLGNKTYYMNNKGEMQIGFNKVNGETYYMDNKGVMQTGWVKINNQWHIFNDNGEEIVSSPNGGVLNQYTAKRLYGPRRIETAIQVSREGYPDNSADNVILAGIKGEADALAGTILAAVKDAPLLLVSDYQDIERELKRLGAKNIYILGGNTVVSSKVENELKAAKYNVERVAGKNRYGTAVKIAEESKANTNHVFLTNDGQSGSLADALAIGPVSGKNKAPILLTDKNGLPKPTLDALKTMNVKEVTIIGGEIAVSKQVEKELKDNQITVERIAGTNRYETAAKIADEYFGGSEKAIVTNDGKASFADALMGGYLGAKEDAPILLTATNKLNARTANYLKTSATSAYVLGGEKVIEKKNLEEIQKQIKVKIK